MLPRLRARICVQVCASRMPGLQHHKQPFAHDTPFCKTLLEAVRLLKPVAIIGAWGLPCGHHRCVGPVCPAVRTLTVSLSELGGWS